MSDDRSTPAAAISWGQSATLIDLDGTAPLIATLGDCARHFRALNTTAKSEARILLTQPMRRVNRKTRVWLLNPDEIQQLADRVDEADPR